MRLPAIMIYDHFNYKDQPYKTEFDEQERLNHDKRIPCITLKRYTYLSFIFIQVGMTKLLFATGHDHASFSKLLHKFKPTYETYLLDPETGLIH